MKTRFGNDHRPRRWRGWILLLWMGLAPALGGVSLIHETPAGTLALPLPGDGSGWRVETPRRSGDLLFPDGVSLASFRQEAGDRTMITVSLDEGYPTSGAERSAFLALARDRAAEGRMEVWDDAAPPWIVQEFRSPSERVLAAQSFVGPYAIAFLFWFDPAGEPAVQEALARRFLRQWGPRWTPLPASPE